MRFGIREIGRISQASFPIWKRGFVVTGVFLPGSSRSHRSVLQDERLRTPLPRMRQDFWQSATQYLRRLLLSPRSHLRLRFDPAAGVAAVVYFARAEPLEVSRAAAFAGGVSAVAAYGIHASAY